MPLPPEELIMSELVKLLKSRASRASAAPPPPASPSTVLPRGALPLKLEDDEQPRQRHDYRWPEEVLVAIVQQYTLYRGDDGMIVSGGWDRILQSLKMQFPDDAGLQAMKDSRKIMGRYYYQRRLVHQYDALVSKGSPAKKPILVDEFHASEASFAQRSRSRHSTPAASPVVSQVLVEADDLVLTRQRYLRETSEHTHAAEDNNQEESDEESQLRLTKRRRVQSPAPEQSTAQATAVLPDSLVDIVPAMSVATTQSTYPATPPPEHLPVSSTDSTARLSSSPAKPIAVSSSPPVNAKNSSKSGSEPDVLDQYLNMLRNMMSPGTASDSTGFDLTAFAQTLSNGDNVPANIAECLRAVTAAKKKRSELELARIRSQHEERMAVLALLHSNFEHLSDPALAQDRAALLKLLQ
ncbi:hypothetical protein RI367_004145 [Sorochytrium milnesiophthora]